MRTLDFALSALVLCSALSCGPSGAGGPAGPAPSLAGTWTLSAADDLLPDGSRVKAYGESPQGLLVLTPEGRYSLQIFRSDRAKFASGNKRRGTAAEYEAAVLGMSSHVGRYAVDAANHTITFSIERASYPNWDGTEQKRPFELSGDEFSYRVAATPDGVIPISVWRRAR
jgi:lipocalin-like protein